MAKTNETLEEMLKAVHSDVKEIKTQTIKTNGRVNKLESFRDKVVGALIVMNIILIPLAIGYLLK